MKEKIKESIESHMDMVLPITYNILFVNDISCGLVIDSLSMLKNNNDIFSFKTKMYAKKVDLARACYEKKINTVIGKRCGELFADNNEDFLEEVKKDIDVLYFSIKNVYDKEKMPYSDLLSKLEMTRTILEYSCNMVDNRMKELKGVDDVFNIVNIGYMRLTNLLRLFNLMMDSLKIRNGVCLNEKGCNMSMKVIDTDFSDMDKIYKVIMKNGNKDIL